MSCRRPISERKLAANRANAKRSTGPRTAAGKARSRWNALKHGVLSESLIPEPLEHYESRASFDSLLEGLREEFAPATPAEGILVEAIATCYWRLARLVRAEAGAIAYAQTANDAPGSCPFDPALDWLQGQIDSVRAALDDPAALRRMFDDNRDGCPGFTDAQLRQAGGYHLAQLEKDLVRYRKLRQEASRTSDSLPALDLALAYSRYEAQLQRQLYRALTALDRRQRQRVAAQPPGPGAASPSSED